MPESKHLASKPHKKITAKTAAASKATPKPFKSAEFVGDSDEDDDPAALRTTAKPTASQKHTLNQEEVKQREKTDLRPEAIALSRKRKSPTPSISESGSSNAESSFEERSPIPKRVRTSPRPSKPNIQDAQQKTTTVGLTRRRSGVPSSDQSVSSKSGTEEELSKTLNGSGRVRSNAPSKQRHQLSGPPESNNKKLDSRSSHSPVPTEVKFSDSQSTEESGNGTGSESRSDEGSSQEETEKRKTPEPHEQQAPLLPYALPPGFEPTSLSSNPASKATELFAPATLQGKQLWHITVPAGVSIEPVEEVALQKVQDGSSVLSHKGADYGLIAETDDIGSRDVLLLPSIEDDQYKISGHAIVKTLHLQQLVGTATAVHDNDAIPPFTASADRARQRKPVPQQPEGLRMRYRPFGDSDSGTSSSNGIIGREQPPPQFRVPKGVPETASPPKKRKRDEPEAPILAEGQSPKKSRKDRKDLATSMPLTNGEKTSPIKGTPITHDTPPKDKSSKAKHDKTSKTTPSKKSTQRKESRTIAETPVKPRSAAAPGQANHVPPDDKVASPIKETLDARPSKPKEKSRKKHCEGSAEALSNILSHNEQPATTNGEPRKESPSSTARSDHDRDATAGAESPYEAAPPRVSKEAKLNEVKAPPSTKKSKHEGETADEKARRKAAKRAKHEGETAEEKEKRRAARRRRKELKASGGS